MHRSLLVFAFVLIICCNLGHLLTENFAFNKECKQSSTANPNAETKYCYRATDGNKSVCSRTKFESGFEKWWLVDFNRTVQVQSVVITNSHNYPDRLTDFTIKTYDLDPTIFNSNGSMCYYHSGPFPANSTAVKCTTASFGRYLEIAKLNMNASPLELCEVEVYGVENSTQVKAEGYCENKEARMNANNMSMDTTTSIECARYCFHELSCLAFNYEHVSNNNCILLTEIGPINYEAGVSYWEKCTYVK